MFLFVTGPDLFFVGRFFLVSGTNIVQGFHVFFPLVFSHSSVNWCMSFRKVHATPAHSIIFHLHFYLVQLETRKKKKRKNSIRVSAIGV